MKPFLFVLVLVLGFSLQANAELIVRGTDNLGNQLIYDTDFDITWYDFTQSINTWQSQMNWADALSVNFAGTIYTDWRLPTALNQDGSGPCRNYGCTGSEMGHLYYTELGNVAGSGLVNKGSFLNIKPTYFYWTNTKSTSTSSVIYFAMHIGLQDWVFDDNPNIAAIAVHTGDVAVVPEPISSILFLTGGATLIGRKYIKRKKKEV